MTVVEEKSPCSSGLAVAMIGSRGLAVCHSGLEVHVREIARSLASQGNRIVVYGQNGCDIPRLSDTGLHNIGATAKDGFCLKGKLTSAISNTVWATLDAIRAGCYDVLHYHGVGCVFGIILACRSGIPVALTLHSTNWQEEKWSPVSKWLIHYLEQVAVRSADAVIAVSGSLARRVQQEYGVFVHVIPNGVRAMGDPNRDDEVLRTFHLEKGRFLLYAGRLVRDKGCHTLANAFREAGIPLKLILAGPHQDVAYTRSLLAGAPPSVCAPGTLDELQLGALYRHCWAFCSASFTEGQSRAVMEALAHEATCLVSDIPGHRELVTDPRMRFPPDDVAVLRDRLLSLHSTGTAARTHGDWLFQNPHYGLGSTVQRLCDVYLTILGKNSVRRASMP